MTAGLGLNSTRLRPSQRRFGLAQAWGSRLAPPGASVAEASPPSLADVAASTSTTSSRNWLSLLILAIAAVRAFLTPSPDLPRAARCSSAISSRSRTLTTPIIQLYTRLVLSSSPQVCPLPGSLAPPPPDSTPRTGQQTSQPTCPSCSWRTGHCVL